MHRALQLHFKPGTYDYVKYHGKVKVDPDKFHTRKDRFHYERLKRKFQGNRDQIEQFLVANLHESPSAWIGTLTSPESMTKYKSWQAYHESLTYNFQSEMESLASQMPGDMTANEMLIPVDGDHPWLLDKFYEGVISPSSMIIMQSVLKFFAAWNKRIDDDILWPETRDKLVRLAPFIDANLEKSKKVLRNTFKSTI